jgi:SNF2 family DNA or RNA helicase
MQLRKICNHPSLSEADQSHIPADLLNSTFEEQGSKLAVVSYLLHHLREAGSEKIVLVSISTQVLDLLGDLCQHYSFPFLRLDGSTSALQRQNVVTTFNGPYGKESVLLLSSKAGGTGKLFHQNYNALKLKADLIFPGLNLIGASRILLYDMDWNPAHDIQGILKDTVVIFAESS